MVVDIIILALVFLYAGYIIRKQYILRKKAKQAGCGECGTVGCFGCSKCSNEYFDEIIRQLKEQEGKHTENG